MVSPCEFNLQPLKVAPFLWQETEALGPNADEFSVTPNNEMTVAANAKVVCFS
jgi:hypothetical protein